jgi:uncharacterized Ntn-hydrolase superfamily protein
MNANRPRKTLMWYLLASAWMLSGGAQATWSIIVLDPDTRAIGLAGAPCSGYVAGIAGFVPGKGAVMAQAASNWAAKTKAEELVSAGVTPDKILAVITDAAFDSKFAQQQYAIMTFDAIEKPANFNGAETPGFRGSLTGPGFSVQGNTLVSGAVLEAAARAIAEGRVAKRPLAELLLAFLDSLPESQCALPRARQGQRGRAARPRVSALESSLQQEPQHVLVRQPTAGLSCVGRQHALFILRA